jgi:hypothetical protein
MSQANTGLCVPYGCAFGVDAFTAAKVLEPNLQ